MPSIQINDAEIYYEMFGDDHPSQAPIHCADPWFDN